MCHSNRRNEKDIWIIAMFKQNAVHPCLPELPEFGCSAAVAVFNIQLAISAGRRGKARASYYLHGLIGVESGKTPFPPALLPQRTITFVYRSDH